MSRDCIRIVNMTFYGHHGVEESERELGGRFAVDVELYLDLGPAGSTDDLSQTVDYKAVYGLVRNVESARNYELVEALAHDVAQGILESFAKVDEVVVRVRKQSVPLGGLIDYTEAEIRRHRSPSDSGDA